MGDITLCIVRVYVRILQWSKTNILLLNKEPVRRVVLINYGELSLPRRTMNDLADASVPEGSPPEPEPLALAVRIYGRAR